MKGLTHMVYLRRVDEIKMSVNRQYSFRAIRFSPKWIDKQFSWKP
jgi:hypothetical protein